MSCFGCSRKYGLFCKEYGCPNCGYSYCVKCLKRPMPVPRQGNVVLNVCLICYDKLSKQQANANAEKVIDCDALPGELVTRAPPKGISPQNAHSADELFDNTIASEDLGSVLTPATNETKANEEAKVITTHSTNAQDIDENLDSAISKRLQNLKAVETTDDEIRARLSDLSGMPHQKNYDKKDLLLSTDQRTDQEKMKDLLEQFVGEAQLDQRIEYERNDAVSDIERRLRALRDVSIDNAAVGKSSGAIHSPDSNTPSDNETEEDEQTALKKVIEKYLAEAHLPPGATELESELASSMPLPPAPGSAAAADTEELPWCNICNEDATYRCRGCDGELFCAQCYRECHDDDDEYRAHIRENYRAPPKFKENHF